MCELIRLIHLVPGERRDIALAGLLTALNRVVAETAPERALVRPTLPGVRNGGDILLRLRFADPAVGRAAARRLDEVCAWPDVARVDGADYGPGAGGVADTAAAEEPVYRTLLLRVDPATAPDRVAEFESDLLLMPRYIPAIRTWRLSPVERAVGSTRWTHVWEQEFADLDGLTGAYLLHPVHWGLVDRWFDPECPQVIVRDRVCHSFCPGTGSVLGPTAR
ncbi:Dabb family protein [Nocardia sp. NPDC003345]